MALMTKRRSRDPINVPDVRTASVRLRELGEKRGALVARVAALRAERMAMIREHSNSEGFLPGADAARVREHKERVRTLLGEDAGRLLTGTHAIPGTTPAERVVEILAEIEAAEAAAALLAQEIEVERGKASAVICRDVKPLHDGIVADVVAAIGALNAATLAYCDVIRACERAGVSTASLNPLPVGGIVGGKGCVLLDLLQRAKAAGYIDELPDNLR